LILYNVHLKGVQTLVLYETLLYRGKYMIIRKYFSIIDENKWCHENIPFLNHDQL
jgi:hypothetical protein